jgi:lipopolysaccharide/colanic/teichoic acid biosynthesis glycosyltransferase
MKRLLDLIGGATGALVLAPIIAGVAVVVRVTMGSPVIFRQVRPGTGGVPFVLYKFRTMVVGGEGEVTDGERFTPAGQLLRSTSLDELPELWNVLKGDMSLVGPRPLLMEYVPLYSAEQARRHEVSPGITGLAQVMGRNDTTWERRLALDVWYVDHQSIWLDLRILAMTLVKVVSRTGISAEGEATMPRFEGTQSG